MNGTHPLVHLREQILDVDNPGRLLGIADGYLMSFARMGSDFVLPADHDMLKPILAYYAGDLAGWLRYVKSIRDAVGRKDPRWGELRDLYRTLEVRYSQRVRRERLNAATEMAIRLHLIANTPEEKARYEKRCTLEWEKQRTALLYGTAKTKKRVPADERSLMLEEFWKEVDESIATGKVPAP